MHKVGVDDNTQRLINNVMDCLDELTKFSLSSRIKFELAVASISKSSSVGKLSRESQTSKWSLTALRLHFTRLCVKAKMPMCSEALKLKCRIVLPL